jgi:hypothetical protein
MCCSDTRFFTYIRVYLYLDPGNEEEPLLVQVFAFISFLPGTRTGSCRMRIYEGSTRNTVWLANNSGEWKGFYVFYLSRTNTYYIILENYVQTLLWEKLASSELLASHLL